MILAHLFPGPLDVVGDVHGEIDALDALVRHLGYDGAARHPAGRHLVFVGDLCDRGPDSPAVLDRVQPWVESGAAQCVLGNHELNVLLGAPKHGNGWFFDRNHDVHSGEFLASAAATAERREAWRPFLERLPLALTRPDLRVVHACWDPVAVATLRSAHEYPSHAGAHEHYRAQAKQLLQGSGVEARAAHELQPWRHVLSNPHAAIPYLPACAEVATTHQNANPVKVLTSGIEERAGRPAWAGGQWRMTNRARWWESYRDAPTVLVGHYWRRDGRAWPVEVTEDWDYPLAGYGPYEWMGPRHNVYCLDYSVGGRFKERKRGGGGPFECRLAALRWPERELVFDDGERIATRIAA
ncbi:MAG: metallophosphoesterase [Steroidobacteraceae bacterium]